MVDAPKRRFVAPVLKLPKKPAPLGESDLWAGRARAVGQGLFSFGDEAEAAVRAGMGEDYTTALNDIRAKYRRYKDEEPGISTGIELGTGIASAFIPGVGLVGRGAQALGRLPGVANVAKAVAPTAARLSPFAARVAPASTGIGAAVPSVVARQASNAARAAANQTAVRQGLRVGAQGAASGAASGFGAGEGGFENRAATGAVGAVLGGGLGALAPAAGAATRFGADAYRNATGKVSPERTTEMVNDMLLRSINRGGQSIPRIYQNAARDEAMGIPSMMAQTNPELMKLAETVVSRPSTGRRELVQEIADQQTGAATRVTDALQQAVPSKDYFSKLDDVTTGMRQRADTVYEKAYEHGDINDTRILGLLDNPDMKKAYQDAMLNSERLAAAATARGEDASKYALKPIYDPVLDVQGNLVGANITGSAPDVRTLDYVKQALDRRISSLYASGQGGEANALKEMRNSMVERLDEKVPAYAAARAQYKGDIEIVQALEQGRDDIARMRPQEVYKLWNGKNALSAGEKEAFKTGVLQHLLQPIEDATGNRNFAQHVIGSKAWRSKLKTMLPPGEFRLLDASLRREAELFKGRSSVLGGSATAGRVASKEDLDRAIDGGNFDQVVDMISSGRAGIFNAGVAAYRYAKRANVSDAVYTQLARVLKTSGPEDIAKILRSLRDAAPARTAKIEKRIGAQQTGVRGIAASMGPGPGEGADMSEPEPEKPFKLNIPNFGGAPTMAPGPDLQ